MSKLGDCQQCMQHIYIVIAACHNRLVCVATAFTYISLVIWWVNNLFYVILDGECFFRSHEISNISIITLHQHKFIMQQVCKVHVTNTILLNMALKPYFKLCIHSRGHLSQQLNLQKSKKQFANGSTASRTIIQ